MIIDVALQGDANMQKLASKAKKAAVDINTMSTALKDTGVNLDTARGHVQRFQKDLGKVEKELDIYVKKKEALAKAERGQTKAIGDSKKAIADYKKDLKKANKTIAETNAELINLKTAHKKAQLATKDSTKSVKDLEKALGAAGEKTKEAAALKKKLTAARGKETRTIKKEMQALQDVTVATDKKRAATKALGVAETGLSREKKNLIKLEGTWASNVKEAGIALDAQEKVLTRLRIGLDKGKKGILSMDGKTKEWTLSQKKLKIASDGTKEAIDRLNIEIKQQNRESTSASKSSKRHGRSINELGISARRTNKHFKDWHDQRIGQHGGITVFRQSLGALRNQLLVLAFATRGIINVFKKAFNATKQMESALRGLGSVAMNTGAGMEVAQQAAIALAKGGLMNVSEAAAGLKNLLSAGYGMKEAVKMMNVLTDAAAFNRQGTLELGEAIVGATQGIKNQNSIMVDNAGITKNLSVMYKEYATAIGTTMGKLSEAEKRQAIYNGLLKEGAVFAGDAAKVMDTMEGGLAKYKVTVFNAAAALGDVMKPAVQGIVKAMEEAAQNVEEFFKDGDKKKEFMYAMKDAGEAMAGAISTLASVLGKLGQSFISVSSTMIGGALLKFLIAYRIVSKLILKLATRNIAKMDLLTKKFKAYRIQVKGTAIGMRQLADGTKVAQYSQDKLYYSNGKLLKGWQLYRVQLTRVMLTYNRMAISGRRVATNGKVLTFIFGKQLPPELARATMGFRAMGKAIKLSGGYIKVFKGAIKALLMTLGRLALYFIVFEAMILFYNWITSAGKAEKALAKAANSMNKSFKKIAAGHKATTEGIEKTTNRVGFIGINTGMMDHELGILDAHLEAIRDMKEKHNQELDEERRNKIAEGIEDMTENYQTQLEKLGNAHREILAQEAAFNERLGNISAGYATAMEDYYKKSGLNALQAAKVAIKEQLEAQEWFNTQQAAIMKKSETQAKVIQTRLNMWKEYAEGLHSIAMQKIKDDFTKKEQNIQKRIDAVRIRTTNTANDIIITKYQELNKNITTQISNLQKEMKTSGDGLVKTSTETALDVTNAFIIMVDSKTLGDAHAKFYEGLSKNTKLFAENEVEAIEKQQRSRTDLTKFWLDHVDDIHKYTKQGMSLEDAQSQVMLESTRRLLAAMDEIRGAHRNIQKEAARSGQAMITFGQEMLAAEKYTLKGASASQVAAEKLKMQHDAMNKLETELVKYKTSIKKLMDQGHYELWSEEAKASMRGLLAEYDTYIVKIKAWRAAQRDVSDDQKTHTAIVKENAAAIKELKASLFATLPAAQAVELATLFLKIGLKELNAEFKQDALKQHARQLDRVSDSTKQLHKISTEFGKKGIDIKKIDAGKKVMSNYRHAIKGTSDEFKKWLSLMKEEMNTSQSVIDAKSNLAEAEANLVKVKQGTIKTTQEAITTEVKQGEGLAVLAKRMGITIEKLKELNKQQLKTYKGGVEGFDEGAIITGGTQTVTTSVAADPSAVTTAQGGVDTAQAGVAAAMAGATPILTNQAAAWDAYSAAVQANNEAIQKNLDVTSLMPAMFEGALGAGLNMKGMYEDQAVAMAMMQSGHVEAVAQMDESKTAQGGEIAALKLKRQAYVDAMEGVDGWLEKDAALTDQNLISLDAKIANAEVEHGLMDGKIEHLKEEQKQELETAANKQAQEAFKKKIQAWQTGISTFSKLLGGLVQAHQKITAEETKYRDTLKSEINEYDDWDQKQKLLNANKDKEFEAARQLQNAKALASLAKTIIIEISLYMARAVAKQGGIAGAVAGMAIIAAGQIAGAAAERAMVADAQRSYDKTKREVAAEEERMRAEWDKELEGGEDGEDPEADTSARQLGGTIKAEQLAVSISPTIVVSGEQVFIGQGSVTEFSLELRALMIDSAQQAIETGELDITPLGGSNLMG
jgi:hypothetical protein